MRAFMIASLLASVVAAGPTAAEPPANAPDMTCACDRFVDELTAAEQRFATRGEGTAVPVTSEMTRTFRARVDGVYASATCLAGCDGIADRERNRARALGAEAGFKTVTLKDTERRTRLERAVALTARCLETEAANPRCLLWHASARGVLARGSWNPLNITLPKQILSEFRAARGGAAPGEDELDGKATRGEAYFLLRAPKIAGGDPVAARELMDRAAAAPRYRCVVTNRLARAEAHFRTGDAAGATAELADAITPGLPDCTRQRYEDALHIEEATRCLARLRADPAADPGWDDACE